MSDFHRQVQLRWSDLDPNFHVRHSIYYDWGAMVRVAFLDAYGLNYQVMQQLGFGPILFREECTFRKEVRSGDKLLINLQIIRARQDYSRWSIRHHIMKEDGTLCAVLTVEGAWMDVNKRKLASPPEKVNEVFAAMPRAEDFEWS